MSKTINLNMQEIQLVMVCLSKQPYEAVAQLISKIQTQVKEQETPKQEE